MKKPLGVSKCLWKDIKPNLKEAKYEGVWAALADFCVTPSGSTGTDSRA
jgi:hypothetical protein